MSVSDSTIQIKIPNFEDGETITHYLKKVEEFNINRKKDKYDLILKFINKWLNYKDKYKLKSLKEFKLISEKYLLRNPKYNRDILRKFSPEIIKILDITFDIKLFNFF